MSSPESSTSPRPSNSSPDPHASADQQSTPNPDMLPVSPTPGHADDFHPVPAQDAATTQDAAMNQDGVIDTPADDPLTDGNASAVDPDATPAATPDSHPTEPDVATPAVQDINDPSTQKIARGVFYPAAGILVALVIAAIAIPNQLQSVISFLSGGVINSFSWYYVLTATGFVVFVITVAMSRFGDIKLGRDDDEPQYSLGSWFAMLFAAGMGIGLVFYGVGEPLSHFASPRPGVEGSAPELAREAMASTFLHWGFHAWSIYVVVGLAIAYAHFRRGRPISIRWTLEPVLGKRRIEGRFGDVIDVVAVLGTVLGVATSLGFGVNQVAAGIEYLTGFLATKTVLVVLVIVISALAATSVATGLDAGIKFLSNANLVMAALLAFAVAALGPTIFILNEFVQDIGVYLSRLVELSFQTLPFQGVAGNSWLTSWTTYYWGWWMSWSPFVGIFIARISRGRTIREFILGVMAVPTLVTFLWFAIMGGLGLYEQLFGGVDLIGSDGVNINTVLFQAFEALPASQLLSGLAMIVVIIFFITSSDSGSFVMSMLSTGGHPNPALLVRLTWATLVGAVTAAVLGASSGDTGMAALQSLAILAAFPFSFIMIGMCVSQWTQLRAEHRRLMARERELRRAMIIEDVSSTVVADLARAQILATEPDGKKGRKSRSPIPIAPELVRAWRRRKRKHGSDGENRHEGAVSGDGGDA